MSLPLPYLDEIQKIRHELHQFPEYSGQEKETVRRILDWSGAWEPDLIIEHLGGTGVALVFNGKTDGPTTMFRAELDALNVDEGNDIPWKSRHKDLAHACGHDGHMAILCGLAIGLAANRPASGRVVLLFEPAEESGKGALSVLNDPKFYGIQPDSVFALHNIPGYPKGSILVRDQVFSMASLGLFARLKGHSSHAAFPEHGISPLPALQELLDELPQLPGKLHELNPETFLTVTYARLGHFCFGTSPGNAEFAATLRSTDSLDIDILKRHLVDLIRDKGIRHMLDTIIQWYEPFGATVNHPGPVESVRKAARNLGYPVTELKQPFRWSEDFGEYTSRFAGAIFGLGAGTDHSDLHTPNYDFPDELLEPGIMIFRELIRILHQ